MIEQRLDDAPGLLDRVLASEEGLVADESGVEENLVGGWTLAAFVGELHLEADRFRTRRVGPMAFEDEAKTGARIDPDDELVGPGLLAPAEERERT
jgi:hypothetical protein